MRTHLICSLILVWTLCANKTQAQTSVLFEAGGTYFTNDVENPATHLPDFLAFTFTPRILLFSRKNSGISFDIPLSFRSKYKKGIITETGVHLPALITYNYGAGASGQSSSKKFGVLAGLGFGYFYQHTESKPGYTPAYKESLSVRGPIAQMGARITLSKVTLFNVNEKNVHPYIVIKTTYQADLKNHDHDIGSLSLLMGVKF